MITRAPRHLFSFSPAARRWVPISSKLIRSSEEQQSVEAKPTKSHLDVVSWNVNFSSGYPSRRCQDLVNHVLKSGIPDIFCLQEVRSEVRATLLGNDTICESFLTNDVDVDLGNKLFTTMTLISKKRFAYSSDPEEKVANSTKRFFVGPVFREQLPSPTGRDGLCVDLIPSDATDTFLRIINVHLEPCEAFPYRAQQLKQLSSLLREPGCSGGLIVGDFNSTTDKDHRLIEENKLEDAWLTLHGSTNPDAPTWDVARKSNTIFEPKRLDKVAMSGGLTVESMEVMHPGCIDELHPRRREVSDQIRWSDHSGLRCKVLF